MANLFRNGIKSIIAVNNIKPASISIRCITSKALRAIDTNRPQKPAPYPFDDKPYTILHSLFDKTTSRLDENSKVIVVEGPVAAGKSAFAKKIADELDMLYYPEANLDMIYINSYGYDLRKLDSELPESCRSFDINNFLVTPKHMNTAIFQLNQYRVKFSQYIDALAHLLSSGQGVVLDRSPFSDFVFVEAMYKRQFISKPVYKHYYEVRHNSLPELLHPHLIIYLDVPVKKIQDNIKKRNISYEVNSQVLTADYLQTIETTYKQQYLKTMSKHSELLIYDWSSEGDVEVVVEDIERINFSRENEEDPKFSEWDLNDEEDWAMIRNKYADKKEFLLNYFNVPTYHIPELTLEAEDAHQYHETVAAAPGEVYQKGYNENMGDTGLFLKIRGRDRGTLPLTERRAQF